MIVRKELVTKINKIMENHFEYIEKTKAFDYPAPPFPVTEMSFYPETGEIFDPKKIPLDRYANNFSPLQQKDSFRSFRHNLRNAAGNILGREHRVSKCGKTRTAACVSLFRSKVGARFAGLSTCGSVWNCPVCASKIAEGRKNEVQAACERHIEAGGSIYMGTFTVPHNRHDSLTKIRQGMTTAWSRTIAGKGWQTLKDDFGIQYYIKATEVTVGIANGWHPHLHILFFFSSELSEERQTFLQFAIFDRWAKQVEKRGLGECSYDAFDLVKSRDGEGAAHYVAKWGAGSEISKGSSKKAKGGNCAPWELLEKYHTDKNPWAKKMFREYALEMHGARQLTWSKGLKDKYDIQEVADEILAEKELETAQMPLPEIDLPEGQIGIFSKDAWSEIIKGKMTAIVLDLAQSGGWEAVTSFLDEKGIFNELSDRTESLPQPPIDDLKSRNERIRRRIEIERIEDANFHTALRAAAPKNRLQSIADKFFNSGRA